MMFCQYCGARCDDNAKFCGACGKSIIHIPPMPSSKMTSTVPTPSQPATVPLPQRAANLAQPPVPLPSAIRTTAPQPVSAPVASSPVTSINDDFASDSSTAFAKAVQSSRAPLIVMLIAAIIECLYIPLQFVQASLVNAYIAKWAPTSTSHHGYVWYYIIINALHFIAIGVLVFMAFTVLEHVLENKASLRAARIRLSIILLVVYCVCGLATVVLSSGAASWLSSGSSAGLLRVGYYASSIACFIFPCALAAIVFSDGRRVARNGSDQGVRSGAYGVILSAGIAYVVSNALALFVDPLNGSSNPGWRLYVVLYGICIVVSGVARAFMIFMPLWCVGRILHFKGVRGGDVTVGIGLLCYALFAVLSSACVSVGRWNIASQYVGMTGDARLSQMVTVMNNAAITLMYLVALVVVIAMLIITSRAAKLIAVHGVASSSKIECDSSNPSVTEKGSAGWFVLGFFFSIVGLVLWLVWRDSRPGDSRMARNGFIAGIVASIMLYVISYVLFAFANM